MNSDFKCNTVLHHNDGRNLFSDPKIFNVFNHRNYVSGNQKYIYVINITAPIELPKLFTRYPLIPLNVLSDAKSGRAIILIIYMFEGGNFLHPTLTPGFQGPIKDYEIINIWAKKLGLTSDMLHLIHENFNHDILPENCNFKLHSMTTFFCWLQNKPRVINQKIEITDQKYLYLLYNRANRMHRWILGAKLLSNNLLDKGKCSYQMLSDDKNKMSQWASKTQWKHLEQDIRSLEDICPLILEYDDLNTNNPARAINYQHHDTTFVSLVTETVVDGEIFFSEKIWKPVLAGQPFILLSSANSLKWLHRWGFKTFSDWWSESYDNETDLEKRIDKIVDIVKSLSEMSIEKLQTMRREMMPILEHNQNRYLELQCETCDHIWNPARQSDTNKTTFRWGKMRPMYNSVISLWNDFTGQQIPGLIKAEYDLHTK